MAHAYLLTGDIEEGINSALTFAHEKLNQAEGKNADLIVQRHGLFSVANALSLAEIARRAPDGVQGKVIVVSLTRIFHEAQNALLKLFEEPPTKTTLILIVPSDGMLLPTLRSRLMRLQSGKPLRGVGEQFICITQAEREKIIAKLLTRSKSDNDVEKQRARNEIVELVSGLMHVAYRELEEVSRVERAEILAFLEDLSLFYPMLHERSAPLKPILEHMLLVIPNSLQKGAV